MALFIYEHLTSGALIDSTCPMSLLHEGDVMIQAIITDLLDLDCEILTLRDSRLPALKPHVRLKVIPVDDSSDYTAGWRYGIRCHNQVLIIAPETDNILYTLTQQAEQHCSILGSSAETIKITGNKFVCYKHLSAHQILTPLTMLATDWVAETTDKKTQWIIKPIDGAGCTDTFIFNHSHVQQYLNQNTTSTDCIIQPFLEGETLSLSVYICAKESVLFSVNQQLIAQHDNRLSLTGCKPKQSHLLNENKVRQLIAQIRSAIPGLNGFIGIDLIKQGDKLWVIDINPRLTSSYAEPAMRAGENPALPLHQQLIANTK